MNQQQLNHTGVVKKTKKSGPLLPRKAKVKKKKPRISKSRSRDNTDFSPSTLFRSPTPSMCWRSKPSINCDNEIIENPCTSCTSNMFDYSVIKDISEKRYDRLRATLHSTILPIVIPKGSTVVKKTHKSMRAKPAQEIRRPSCERTSVQSIRKPTRAKRPRCWIPTPTEMATIGDKIPRVFVHTSHTGRKSVAVPTDTRTWLCGNLTPIKSTRSAAENQTKLVRGGRALDNKLRRNFKKISPPPSPLSTSPEPTISHAATAKKVSKSPKNNAAAKPSKADPLVKTSKKIKPSKTNSPKKLKNNLPKSLKQESPRVAGTKATKQPVQIEPPVGAKKKKAKASRNTVPPKPAAHSKTKKPVDLSIVKGQVQNPDKTNSRKTQPKKLNSRPICTLYANKSSKLRQQNKKDLSVHSLPSPITLVQLLKAETDTEEIVPAPQSFGYNTFVECFYCHKHFLIGYLRAHQDECAKETLRKRDLEALTPEEFVSSHFENSFHKLNFDGSSCSLLSSDDRPICIEEGGKLAALAARTNETVCKTCWYCGWEYSLDMFDRHMADCSAAQSCITPTAQGKKLRALVEKRMKTFGRRHPKKKKDLLWCKDV